MSISKQPTARWRRKCAQGDMESLRSQSGSILWFFEVPQQNMDETCMVTWWPIAEVRQTVLGGRLALFLGKSSEPLRQFLLPKDTICKSSRSPPRANYKILQYRKWSGKRSPKSQLTHLRFVVSRSWRETLGSMIWGKHFQDIHNLMESMMMIFSFEFKPKKPNNYPYVSWLGYTIRYEVASPKTNRPKVMNEEGR